MISVVKRHGVPRFNKQTFLLGGNSMKKILSLALIAVLCAALVLATGCTPKETTGDKDTSSVTIENIYGSSELTQEQIEAFQNSGEITLYSSKADIVKGEYDDDTKAALDFYKKYYGLTIKYKDEMGKQQSVDLDPKGDEYVIEKSATPGTDPSDPTDSSEPTEGSEPSTPSEPTEGSEPSQPTESTGSND